MLDKFPELNYLKPSYQRIDPNWQLLLLTKCHSQLINIDAQLSAGALNHEIYPPRSQIFNALALTNLDKVRIVILGQDPYHGVGEANGLAFAVNPGVKIPPSLRNIYKEAGIDPKQAFGLDVLAGWAKQGVLLLNSSLTVIKDKPNSLAEIGWQAVTDQIIQAISDNCTHVVFMLWGSFAGKKVSLINAQKHLILQTTHPSPFSAHKGFLGSDHFNIANEYLVKNGNAPIDWGI